MRENNEKQNPQCEHCGIPCDYLPENYFGVQPRKVCTLCEGMLHLIGEAKKLADSGEPSGD